MLEYGMAVLKLFLLGPFLATLDNQPLDSFPTSKVQALLIYLAVESQTTHRREYLMELLWPGMPLESAQVNLRQTLYRLRKTVPEISNKEGNKAAPFLLTDRLTVRFNPEADLQLDVHTFQAQIDQDPVAAVRLYRDDFLADFYLADSSEFEDWVEGWRESLRRTCLETCFDLAEKALEAGDYSQAQAHAWRQLEFNHLSEQAYRQLMTALAKGGQRNAALAQYQICRRRLLEELGLEPSPETTALYEQIQADALQAAKAPPATKKRLPGEMPVFLLTDIEGSTRLWDTYRQAMLPALLQHNAILEECITRHGGRILELRGDGVKAVFESVNPLQCMLDIQQALGAADWGEIGDLRIRMGLHGVNTIRKDFDYFIKDEKYFGPVLNHTARIMDAGHGGQILVSEQVHNAFSLPTGARWQDFGQHLVKSLDQPLQIYGLLHPDLPHLSFPPLRTGSDLEKHVETDDLSPAKVAPATAPTKRTIRHNLPAQPNPFIGREEELANLETLINEPNTRLITILGPGGMGKTRLALAVAERVLKTIQIPDGVFFVDMAPLNEARQIPLAIAERLEIELTGAGDDPGTQLVDFLSDKTMLLILDNIEHLLDGTRLLAEIGRAAPNIQLLVTSRQRLGLRGEQIYTLQGLDSTDWVTLEEATGYSAVQLFAGAARRMSADFKLTDDDLPHLTRLCQLVSGMPLALELAAGWVELLPISKIAHEIERGLGLLETDLQDVPDRQRSIQTVFETTWEKLEPAEQDFLQKLSVFRGGFTLEAAQNVATQQNEMAATLKLLIRLVNKSLLQSDPTRDRYQLHELLRQYLFEHFDKSGDLEATHTAHSEYFLQLLRRQEAVIKMFVKAKQSFDLIETEFSNIRAAWDWTLARGNLADIDHAIFSLTYFAFFRRRELEFYDMLTLALNHFDSVKNHFDNPIWRRVFVRQSAISMFSGKPDVDPQLDTLKKIVEVERKEGDKSRLATVLAHIGFKEGLIDLQAGLPYLQESLAIYRELKDTFNEPNLLDHISWLYQIHGYTEQRVDYTTQRLELARRAGYQWAIADATAILGFTDELAGRYAASERKYEKALPVYQENKDRFHYAEYLSQLAGLALLKGELARARELIEEALVLARQLSNPVVQNVPYGTLGMIHNLEEDYAEAIRQTQKIPDAHTTQSFVFYRPKGMAYAQCGLGDFSSAKHYLREAFETALINNAPGWQVQCLPAAALIAASDADLERATELLSLSFHHPAGATGWLEKFPLITSLRERLESELSPAAFQGSWNNGRRLSLSETVAALKDELAGVGWGWS